MGPFSILFLALLSTTTNGFVVEAENDGAFVEINEFDEVTLGNNLFTVTFNSNATAKSLHKNGVNILENIAEGMQTWYLDWNGERAYFTPSLVEIVRNTPEQAHVRFVQEANYERELMYIEFHMVVFPALSGIYQYIKLSNPTDLTVDFAEFRTVHRFDHALMPKVSNIIRSEATPDVSGRPLIQDTTWQLADGTYWSKYDLCGYIRETPWFGVYGGGFGGWIVSASREYHSAGPLKQELLVHQDSLMLNYFHSTHFGTPNLLVPPGWSKFFGPYLVYINTGSEEEVLADAANQALIEQSQWPYSWVEDEEYPLSRGSVSGRVTGQTKAMVVVYDAVEQQFDLQNLGYLFHAETNEDGTFAIENIRPGSYDVVAYPLAGHGSENLARKSITVEAGGLRDVGDLELPEPTGIIWAIGETDRKSDGFRYSHELRNFYWHLVTPKKLQFVVGQSNHSREWYYSQSEGVWQVVYEDQPDNQGRILRLAIAAATGSLIFNVTTAHLQVEVNDVALADFEFDNDKAVYRDALQSGNFFWEKITVPAETVIDGENVLSLRVTRGSIMYDAISLAREAA
ncbi:rhamnogalacturonate lyase isoform X1 [Dendroctonus ponderosae]|uniref:rhamnogalacturonate lyase isoform X1 n=1 Tax=Dendroctonus ponderosae TaxID=77166 RepID=UPI002035AF3A|nr:rhamnogalacturonate lyase isoform X1 [Dendroctonus ponderosae]